MNLDKDKLINLFDKTNKKTCFIIKNNEIIFDSSHRGVKPIIDYYLSNGKSKAPLTVVDKIIGKGAIMLAAFIGAKTVITPTISEVALEFADNFGIKAEYKNTVPYIINREGNGQCPIEKSVESINDINEAYYVISKKLEELKK